MVEVVINEFLTPLAYIRRFAFSQHGVVETVAVLVYIMESDRCCELITEIGHLITQQTF